MQHFFFFWLQFFTSWSQSLKIFSVQTKDLHLSDYEHVSCSEHTPSKLATCGIVIKVHILVLTFIVTCSKHTCATIMPFNQHLYLPHQSGGWIIFTTASLFFFCSLSWQLIYTYMLNHSTPEICCNYMHDPLTCLNFNIVYFLCVYRS